MVRGGEAFEDAVAQARLARANAVPPVLAPRLVVRAAGDRWPALTEVDDLQLPLRSEFRELYDELQRGREELARGVGQLAADRVHSETLQAAFDTLEQAQNRLWRLVCWLQDHQEEERQNERQNA